MCPYVLRREGPITVMVASADYGRKVEREMQC